MGRFITCLCLILGGCHPPEEIAPTADLPAPPPPENFVELADQIAALDDGPIKMLFVLHTTKGEISKTADVKRQLTFSVEDVTSVVGFTDRPDRYAFTLTASMLATIWDTGSDSIAKDPPNAVIEDAHSRIGVTEITGFALDEGVVTVQLDQMAYRSIDAGDSLDGETTELTLFIDSFLGLKITGASVAFGLQQAAKACVSVDCELWPLGA